MNMTELKTKAKEAGLTRLGRLRKPELIQAIQVQEGNEPCFLAEWRSDCSQDDCCWRSDCLK